MEKDIDEKMICCQCIGEKFLTAVIEKETVVVGCSYCDNDDVNGCTILEFADRIDTAFQDHYTRSPENPPDDWSIWQIKNQEYEPAGDPIVYAIMDAANIEEEIALDVQKILEDKHYDRSAAEIHEYSEYHSESVYDKKYPQDVEWQEKWSDFELSLKTKNRFFSKEGAIHLASVFEGVEKMNTHDNKPVAKMIGPGTQLTHLIRARVFQNDEKLKTALKNPDRELGAPPNGQASPGRMNSKGVSMFYGAINSKTAVAEVRPPVGSKVTIAKFEILQPLKMLDLSALTYNIAKGSIFDPSYAKKLAQSMFLSKLSQKMTHPVMPDEEYFDYLPTQVVADFVDSVLEFDGFIFPSAQYPDGVNIVLFNKAARATNIEHVKGTRITASLTEWDDDIEIPSYSVTKWIPNQKDDESKTKEDAIHLLFGGHLTPNDPDTRKPMLKIDVTSIIIKHISAIKIVGKELEVLDYNYPTSGNLDIYDE